MTKAVSWLVIFRIGRSQNFLPSSDCELFFLFFFHLQVPLPPFSSCCLCCNFHLQLIPPFPASHQQFLFILLRCTFLSCSFLSLPHGFRSPSLLYFFFLLDIVMFSSSLPGVHSAIFILHWSSATNTGLPPLFTHIHTLITPQAFRASQRLQSYYLASTKHLIVQSHPNLFRQPTFAVTVSDFPPFSLLLSLLLFYYFFTSLLYLGHWLWTASEKLWQVDQLSVPW